MPSGICISSENAFIWPAFPADYLEANVQNRRHPEADDYAFAPLLGELCALTGPILVSNCLLPGDLRIIDRHWPCVRRMISSAALDRFVAALLAHSLALIRHLMRPRFEAEGTRYGVRVCDVFASFSTTSRDILVMDAALRPR